MTCPRSRGKSRASSPPSPWHQQAGATPCLRQGSQGSRTAFLTPQGATSMRSPREDARVRQRPPDADACGSTPVRLAKQATSPQGWHSSHMVPPSARRANLSILIGIASLSKQRLTRFNSITYSQLRKLTVEHRKFLGSSSSNAFRRQSIMGSTPVWLITPRGGEVDHNDRRNRQQRPHAIVCQRVSNIRS